MNFDGDLFSSAVRMFSVLTIVIGGLFLLLYVSRRFVKKQLGGTKEKLIRILGHSYIGSKKSIALVEVPGAVLVLGVTNENIRLLDKIDKTDSLEELEETEKDIPSVPFSQYLQRLSSRLKHEKGSE